MISKPKTRRSAIKGCGLFEVSDLISIGLRRSDITDDGLAVLKPLQKLEKLYLLYTNTSDAV